MTTNLLDDIATTADELTNPMRSIERIHDVDLSRNQRLRRVWVVTLPSLLDQLDAAKFPGESYTEDEPVRAAFASRPPARLDAIDRLLAIELGAALWCTRAALTQRDTPASNIRAMVGAAPQLGSDRQSNLLYDLRSWRTWAATVTGWERPPDAPRAPCPLCSERSTLRVRLARHTACCMACGGFWDADTIGLLAEHIRVHASVAETDTKALRTAAVKDRRARERWELRRPDLPYVG